METMRESWTDERLDDFAAHVDRRFDEVDRRFDEVDRRFEEVDRRFDRVDHRLDKVDSHLERIDGRLDAIQRSMFHGVIVLTGGMLAGFSGILVLIATQL